jgi:hypothetical protein
MHRAAAAHADADIVALDRLATPSFFLEDGTLNRRASYFVAGSFVTFLMAEHGLEKFRQLYALTPFVPGKRNAGEPDRWRAVYGQSLDEISTVWRSRFKR